MTIQPLSEYQIGWLQAIFQYAYAPEPHNIQVMNIGVCDDGEMVVEFKKYGHLTTERIQRVAPEKAKP